MLSLMSSHRRFTTALAVLLFAAPLAAQGAPDSTRTKPTSSQRIRITKEADQASPVCVGEMIQEITPFRLIGTRRPPTF